MSLVRKQSQNGLKLQWNICLIQPQTQQFQSFYCSHLQKESESNLNNKSFVKGERASRRHRETSTWCVGAAEVRLSYHSICLRVE